jgi:predicted ArsR family transcriptional regulator
MMGDWTFFSNYGHVLVCLSRNNEARLRDVALEVGITERAVQKIVRDMQDAGFVTVSKQGRCNRYRLNKRKSLRHGLESHCNVGKLLALVTRPAPAGDLLRDPLGAAAEKMDNAEDLTREAASHTRLEPAAQYAKRPTPLPEPAQKSTPNALSAKKKAGKKGKPIDARQQGSLF